MSFFRKPKVANLSEWLEIATRKLVEPSRERIRREVEAHYTEAVEGHCETGLSEIAANAEALAELGDPEVAAKHFRKQHLTDREEQSVNDLNKSVRSITALFLHYFTFAFLIGNNVLWLNWHYYNLSLFIAVEFLILIALPTVCFVIARYCQTATVRHLLLILSVCGPWQGFALNASFMSSPHSDLQRWTAWLVGLVLFYRLLYFFRIWRKLGKTEANWNPTPPSESAQT